MSTHLKCLFNDDTAVVLDFDGVLVPVANYQFDRDLILVLIYSGNLVECSRIDVVVECNSSLRREVHWVDALDRSDGLDDCYTGQGFPIVFVFYTHWLGWTVRGVRG